MPSAFPGAYGWGASSIGGRGGTVLHVTNLNNAGAGSFRAACEASGARIVVFDVGGTVALTAKLQIQNPFITIAGQTAPGGGICISTPEEVSFWAEDFIMRYVRIRSTGDNANQDTFSLVSAPTDVIVDHCSFTWGTDEVLSAVQNGDNITFQWCIIAENTDPGYKASLIESYHVSLLNNLYSNCSERVPRISIGAAAGTHELINNVFYKVEETSGPGNESWNNVAGADTEVDIINNYYKLAGSFTATITEIISWTTSKLYVDGNKSVGMTPNDTGDNWNDGMIRSQTNPYPVLTKEDAIYSASRLALSPDPGPIYSAQSAYDEVLADVGANKLLNADGTWRDTRDAADDRIIADVQNGTGAIINHPDDVGGFPTLAAGTAYTDTDGDGMPDDYEDNMGFDKADDADGPTIAANGYSNVENFLNGPIFTRNRSKRHLLGLM